ncbi:MAG: DNA repair protein RecN [Gammaproteobacteria bacterium]|nr:DNA repair protein RecN [Gammaproteobacteria bacterium]
MLSHLHIQNFAIIRRLELAFAPGMTVLTGETGAGKSIAIDALSLALGGRGEGSMVRAGEAQADISADFELPFNSPALAWLKEQALDEGGECILRRVLSAEGRSKGFINGRPVPLAALRELGGLLVEIHGQHEHQRLMSAERQRELVDAYAGLGAHLAAVRQAYGRRQVLDAEWRELDAGRQAREARLDLLRYQVDELERAAPEPGEAAAIQDEHRRLAHASELMEQAQANLVQLYEGDEPTAFQLLSRAADSLNKLAHYDERLAGTAALLNETALQVREAAHDLSRYLDKLELDPERLSELDARLAELTALARKHRVEADELPALYECMSAELKALTGSDERLEAMGRERAEAERVYQAAAQALSQARQEAAAVLAPLISQHLDGLAIRGGRFEIAISPAENPGPAGMDKLEFRIATNAGQPAQALAKIASGGELSRVSLAIQVVIAQRGDMPVLIFDEVDVGIGGGTAEIVGGLLRHLGSEAQILCVTHQPQVAAQGHQHYRVAKSLVGEATETAIEILGQSERVQEIARMLGGLRITEATLEHAREMLAGEPA